MSPTGGERIMTYFFSSAHKGGSSDHKKCSGLASGFDGMYMCIYM